MSQTKSLVAENVRVLAQAADLVRSIDDSTYAETCGLPVHSAVGNHVRHILDAYACLLAGARSGIVDYERRERDRAVATDRIAALAKVDATIAALEAIEEEDGTRDLLVVPEGLEIDDRTALVESTLSRELQYLAGHTIHHFALVTLMVRLRGYDPGAEFGVAPSTLRHWSAAAR
jgi:uncharacterized damage-inducible protein DinB